MGERSGRIKDTGNTFLMNHLVDVISETICPAEVFDSDKLLVERLSHKEKRQTDGGLTN